jgi:hypothetical protein
MAHAAGSASTVKGANPRRIRAPQHEHSERQSRDDAQRDAGADTGRLPRCKNRSKAEHRDRGQHRESGGVADVGRLLGTGGEGQDDDAQHDRGDGRQLGPDEPLLEDQHRQQRGDAEARGPDRLDEVEGQRAQ